MERNLAQGRAWLEQAAAKGNPVASYNLALILLPSPAEADVSRTIALLRVAANAELPDAQHALGVLYLKGRGVARDPTEAAALFERAAQNGSQVGDVEYAILLFNGDGFRETRARRRIISAAPPPRATPSRKIGWPACWSPDAACRSTRWTRARGIFWRLGKGFPTLGSTMRCAT